MIFIIRHEKKKMKLPGFRFRLTYFILGKSNYFEGASLVFIYALLVAAFYYVPSGDGNSAAIANSTDLVNNTMSF